MSLRSRRARAIRPLSALESCLMAQVEMKDYTSSLFASPSGQTVRPFLVTDGSNVISRSGYAKIVQNSVVEKKLQRHPEEHIGSSDAMLLGSATENVLKLIMMCRRTFGEMCGVWAEEMEFLVFMLFLKNRDRNGSKDSDVEKIQNETWFSVRGVDGFNFKGEIAGFI
ncbi:hypothetical protein CTI12_AA305910 [Artemisia annua]|uniref:Uncharacterized protein n=1 Tax=Artemisia annua TaxID=35608 RepID=A0A2U1N5G8_ARTAN|nr:hypothetical protein CTI12_AA305910 [Artemisia annua]